jgi:hypothetical protein
VYYKWIFCLFSINKIVPLLGIKWRSGEGWIGLHNNTRGLPPPQGSPGNLTPTLCDVSLEACGYTGAALSEPQICKNAQRAPQRTHVEGQEWAADLRLGQTHPGLQSAFDI